MKTILIADDKANIRELRDSLETEDFRVVVAVNGSEALYAARAERPDLILLNIMLPEMSGYDFFKTYRAESATPIILLTTKLDESGLELGADDYISEPFDLHDIVARIHAVLRNAERPAADTGILSIGGILLDKESCAVKSFGRPVSLTPSEFDLLYALMSTPGRAFSRSELLLKLQSSMFEGTERSVDVHVRNLRTKIEPNPSKPIYIKTVFGVGYKFHAE